MQDIQVETDATPFEKYHSNLKAYDMNDSALRSDDLEEELAYLKKLKQREGDEDYHTYLKKLKQREELEAQLEEDQKEWEEEARRQKVQQLREQAVDYIEREVMKEAVRHGVSKLIQDSEDLTPDASFTFLAPDDSDRRWAGKCPICSDNIWTDEARVNDGEDFYHKFCYEEAKEERDEEKRVEQESLQKEADEEARRLQQEADDEANRLHEEELQLLARHERKLEESIKREESQILEKYTELESERAMNELEELELANERLQMEEAEIEALKRALAASYGMQLRPGSEV